MAGISVGGGNGGKKSVDSEIPLIPFIDLLLCCVMFLLVTAVWNQQARVSTNQQSPGQSAPDDPPPEEQTKIIVSLQKTRYVLSSTDGTSHPIPKKMINGDLEFDVVALRNKLEERVRIDPRSKERPILVAPEDGIEYSDVIQAMDVVLGQQFRRMSLADGASL
jgi:biopolymer transport protein ExbD